MLLDVLAVDVVAVDVVGVKAATSKTVVDVAVVDVVEVKGGTSGMMVDVVVVKEALRILHPLRWASKLSRRNTMEVQYTQW